MPSHSPAVPTVLRLIPLLGIAALLLAGAAGAQTMPPAEKLAAIEKLVEENRQRLHIAGAALAIVQDDRVIYSKGFGYRDVERTLPVTPDTLFAIGSSTKAMTAATVLMCADRGALKLTDSPRRHVPYFRLQDPEAHEKITVGDLLCHRSGLQRTDMSWYTGVLKTRDVIRVAGAAKPAAKFGEKFQYQNVMYTVAGEVVAAIEKKPWTRVLHDRLLTPLGMTATTTDVRTMTRTADFAYGYDWNDARKTHTVAPFRHLPSVAPAGCVNSNLTDMVQWVRLMLGGGVFEGRRLLSEASFREMLTERIKISPSGPVGYGYGWFLRQWNGLKVYEHGGNIDGFNAQVAFMPEKKLGLVLLTNISASPLGALAMNAVWRELAGAPAPAAGSGDSGTRAATGPAVAPDREAGRYAGPEGAAVEVAFETGVLKLKVSGQPAYPLENLGGRRYRLGSPAPPGFFATFRPAAGDASKTELCLEQPQGNAVFTRAGSVSAFVASVTVEDLMRRVLEAAGGQENLRRHHTRITRYDFVAENEGLSGTQVDYQRAPLASASEVRLMGAGKEIGRVRSYSDGLDGGAEATFLYPQRLEGNRRFDTALLNAFAPELHWRELFPKMAITGESTLKLDTGEEKVWVLEKTGDRGSRITDYVSRKSHRVLKRVGADGTSYTYNDFREVDGVQIPFRLIEDQPNRGRTIYTVTDVRHDVPIPDEVFRRGARKEFHRQK